MTTTSEYTEQDRQQDFDYYIEHMPVWYQEYGTCYVAIRRGEILGRYADAAEAVESLADQYPIGTYIVPKCDADDSAYKIKVLSFMVA